MAVVLTSLGATASRTTFIKPPDSVRGLTSMPRAMLNFAIVAGVLDAKPVNDTAELIIGVTLDANLAYRFVEMSWSVTQDTANDWRGVAYMEVLNGIRSLEALAVQRHPIIVADVTRIPQAGEMWVASFRDTLDSPRYIFQTNPRGSPAAPVVTFKAANDTAAPGAAGTVDFHCSFMEFDIEQVELYPSFWPQLAYSR